MRRSARRFYGAPVAAIGGGFNPISALWPLGTEAGMWLDPSDAATGWQASTGAAAGVVNSPVGLRLDKRLGLPLGSEVNGDVDFNTPAGWTPGAGWAVSGGFAVGTATSGFLSKNATTLASGDVFSVTVVVSAVSAGSVCVYVGSAGTARTDVITTPGTYTLTVRSDSANDLGLLGAGFTGTVDSLSIKKVSGNHVLQATAAARPTWKLNGAIYSDLFDGVDDGYATAAFIAGTLTASMDCFIAVNRSSSADMILIYDSVAAGRYAAGVSGGANASAKADSNAGSASTYYVNGTAVPGGTATTMGQLNTAVGTGAWKIVEIRDLDLSTWLSIKYGDYTGFVTAGSDGGVILCPSQSTANRNSIRTFLGAKVGLSL